MAPKHSKKKREFPGVDARKPLNKDERDRLISACRDGRFVTEFVVLFRLFTGLRPLDASHVVSDMVSKRESGIEVSLPPHEVQCQIGGSSGGMRPDWDANNTNCSRCSPDGKFAFDSPRQIPVRHDRTAKLTTDWFELYDSQPSHPRMTTLIGQIGDRIGISRLTPVVLYHSYGVILANKGFSRPEIMSTMGFSGKYARKLLIPSYGEICVGENPFSCNAETTTGTDKCGYVVDSTDDLCPYHSDQTTRCNAPVADDYGESCDRPASQSDSRCHLHTKSE
jgi:hypothetical protein